MNCRAFHRNLADWVSGRLDSDLISTMTAHRESCASCRAADSAERALFETFRALPEPSRECDIRHRLGARIETPQVRRPLFAFPRLALAGTVATAGALFAIALQSQLPLAGPPGVGLSTAASAAPADEQHVVQMVTAMQRSSDPDDEYVIDFASHVPTQQRSVLVGNEGQ